MILGGPTGLGTAPLGSSRQGPLWWGALAWTTRQHGHHAIVGARTPREARAVVELAPLDAADIAALDAASA